jgi:hypothetical protein
MRLKESGAVAPDGNLLPRIFHGPGPQAKSTDFIVRS